MEHRCCLIDDNAPLSVIDDVALLSVPRRCMCRTRSLAQDLWLGGRTQHRALSKDHRALLINYRTLLISTGLFGTRSLASRSHTT